ncbi:MAG: malate synthase G, partial [Pseudomonadota bacterium]|nr:malate synthase G [Pseudomonadota bacterium]
MTDYVARGGLKVAAELADFVETELLAGSDIAPDAFWASFDAAVHKLAPRNRELLAIRASLQSQIDSWLRDNAASGIDSAAYTAFLREIGYLVEEGDDFSVETSHVDQEIASIAGPQLVVPITNARYALNAANARFGSLYDAFYGTDAIPADGDSDGPGYDPVRGARVIARVREFLDETFPLSDGSWRDVTGFAVAGGALSMALGDTKTGLSETDKFAGHAGEAQAPDGIVLRNNGLHVVIRIDAGGAIGSNDAAGINDVIAESALSSIMDCEDSVATVDAEDKVLAYTNWLGLMRGTLEETFNKGGRTVTRKLADD